MIVSSSLQNFFSGASSGVRATRIVHRSCSRRRPVTVLVRRAGTVREIVVIRLSIPRWRSAKSVRISDKIGEHRPVDDATAQGALTKDGVSGKRFRTSSPTASTRSRSPVRSSRRSAPRPASPISARVIISYVPGASVIELKSLKLYLLTTAIEASFTSTPSTRSSMTSSPHVSRAGCG